MNTKHLKLLEQVFKDPIAANIKWKEIESLVKYLGGGVSEARGSRVKFSLNERYAVFHRPHPHPDTNKATIKDIRKFLKDTGIHYDDL